MYHLKYAFWCEFILQNTLTVLGENVTPSERYLTGRIYLKTITESYRKYQNLSLEEKTNGDESNTMTDQSAEKEFKKYDPKDYKIIIRDDGSISYCYRNCCQPQNNMSAIAAVDYAMRETKPSCGLVKEFKIIPK